MVALLPFRKDENVGAIALIMLIPPLAATGAGPVAAGGAAIVSGLAFNFFFTHPYQSPAIESTASIAAFVVYLVIAIVGAVSSSPGSGRHERLRTAALPMRPCCRRSRSS